ncbi:MAG: carboxypeptidase-like regulatory domain-containing protein [Reichenbachiella sp.]
MKGNTLAIIFISLLTLNDSFSQTPSIVSRQDSASLISLVAQIESSTLNKFHFNPTWIEKVYLHSNELSAINIELLDNLLKDQTDITLFISDKEIFLLKDTHIIEKPAIANFFNKTNEPDILEEEVIFKNQYTKDQSSLEEVLQYVGKKNQYHKDQNCIIAGYIKESSSGDPVDGAFVYIENPFIGASTDETGFYSLSVPSGRQKLLVQSVNMKNTSRKLMVFSDGKFNLDLEVDVIALEAVTIHAERERHIINPQMGVEKITVENLKVVPALLGEKDLIRVATSTAGVQNIGEGGAGINIRGGKADQNLFLLDGGTIFNTNHFFGFFSVFNSDALEGMQLYKSAIPSEYGGRLSSVFDVTSKQPATKWSASGGIGAVTSRLMIEGPVSSKGPSIMLGARATYSDYVLDKVTDSPLSNNQASFYDLIGRIHQKINDNNEISITGYYSHDEFQLASDSLLSYSNFSYSNQLLSFNWKHIFNNNLKGNLNMSSSKYAYKIGYDALPTQAFDIDFSIKENTVAAKFDYYLNEKLNYNFGVEAKHLKVNPGIKTGTGEESLITGDEIPSEQALDFAPYFSATYTPGNKFSLVGGLRYSIFTALGPGTVNTYDSQAAKDVSSIIATEEIEQNEIIKPIHHGPEYRLSGRYSLNDNSSIKASMNRTRQNVHLLLNSASIAPTDMWRLSGAHIKSQIADQASLGYYKNFYGKHTIEASAEVYYKITQNLLDFKVGADLQFNQAIETDILQGKGRSYGLELSLKKSSGWLTGWINYTYSRSLIQLNGNHPEEIVNGGSFFPTGYDKPHYINSITNYKFTRRFTMTLNLVYATGVPATFPTGIWDYQGSENILYSERNAHRIPDYFRMDIGVNLDGSHKLKKLAHSSWSFSVYNILGRDNVYSVFFRVEEGEVKGYKMSVFSHAIPTITYNFRF